jgi:sucrose-6-phosphate hydrolase SacC (GH32 family)
MNKRRIAQLVILMASAFLPGQAAAFSDLRAWSMSFAETKTDKSPIHFMPSKRAVGDVMPFYWKGEYHVFYLTNPTGNNDVNWEHTVSKDLVNWKELPPALTPDKSDPNGPDGECMFTGCVVEKDSVFHAWYQLRGWPCGNPQAGGKDE